MRCACDRPVCVCGARRDGQCAHSKNWGGRGGARLEGLMKVPEAPASGQCVTNSSAMVFRRHGFRLAFLHKGKQPCSRGLGVRHEIRAPSSPPEFLPNELPTPSHCAISTASTAIPPANTAIADVPWRPRKGRGDRCKVTKPLTRPSTRLDHTPHVARNAQDHALPGSKNTRAK